MGAPHGGLEACVGVGDLPFHPPRPRWTRPPRNPLREAFFPPSAASRAQDLRPSLLMSAHGPSNRGSERDSSSAKSSPAILDFRRGSRWFAQSDGRVPGTHRRDSPNED